jgi:prepilin-type N-terminal cleavage/methylation domain-containing protein
MVRSGYSILELMLALALLGVLLTTSWSVLETYRKAEERSWALVERTQAVRISSSWLENDITHLDVDANTPVAAAFAGPLDPASTTLPPHHSRSLSTPVAGLSSGMAKFVGTASGFTTVIVPSLNPSPIMERLFDKSEDQQDIDFNVSARSQLGPIGDLASDTIARRPIALQRLEVSYELSQTGAWSQSGQQDIAVYDLIRRERIDANQSSDHGDDSWHANAEPELNVQDLYRQADESTRSAGEILAENAVHGLANATFWYFDGSTWGQSWNSSHGTMPMAVCLTFDFPPRNGVRPVAQLMDASTSAVADALLEPATAIELISQNEQVLENPSESFELLQKDVKLVFNLPNPSSKTTSKGNSPQPGSQREPRR